MAPNYGAEAPHESDSSARWRGVVLTTLIPLVLGSQTRPMEKWKWVVGACYYVAAVRSQEATTNRTLCDDDDDNEDDDGSGGRRINQIEIDVVVVVA